MVWALAAALVVAGADQEAPVISLNLEGASELITVCRTKEQWDVLLHGGAPHWVHPKGCSPNSETYAKRCEVLIANAASCPEPSASAFDHHEGNLDTMRSLKLEVELPARELAPIRADLAISTVDYNTRGEYMFFWDAKDSSGNEAERVHFAMIMQDTIPPTITLHGDTVHGHVIQAGEGWSTSKIVSNPATANDTFDGNVTDTIELVPTGNVDVHGLSATLNTIKLGYSSVKYTAHDFANVFGVDNKDNTHEMDIEVEVKDTLAPETLCKNAKDKSSEKCTGVDGKVQCENTKECALSPIFHDCGTQFVDPGALCLDQHESWEAKWVQEGSEEQYTISSNKLVPVVTYTHQHEYMGEDTIFYKCTDSKDHSQTTQRRVFVNDWKPPNLRVLDTSELNLIAELECNAGQINYDLLANMSSLMEGYSAETTCHTFIDTCHVDYYKDNCDGEFLCETTGGNDQFHTCSGEGTKLTEAEFASGLNTCTTDESDVEIYAMKYTCRDAKNSVSKCRTIVGVQNQTTTEIVARFNHLPESTGNKKKNFIDAVLGIMGDKCGATHFSTDMVEEVSGSLVAAGSFSTSLKFSIRNHVAAACVAHNLPHFHNHNKLFSNTFTDANSHLETRSLSHSHTQFLDNDFAKAFNTKCTAYGLIPCRTVGGKITCEAFVEKVEVMSHTLPIVDVLEGSVYHVEATKSGAAFEDPGATCTDKNDGIIYRGKQGAGFVDPSTLGEYEVEYPCVDSKGYKAISTFRFVYVHDTKPPTCNLIGHTNMTIEASFPFTDPGVLCTDSFDGKLSNQKQGASEVNVEAVGTYHITYSSTDHSGNSAQIVRNVIVQDTLKPVIAITSISNHANGTPVVTDQQPAHTDLDATNPAVKFWQKPLIGTQKQIFESIFALQTNAGLMAERTAQGSWIAGALVAAAAGIAIVGYRRRQQTPTFRGYSEVNIAAV